MDTIVINNHDDFNNYFPLFKNSASVNSTPNIYFCGMDIEFINAKDCSNAHWVTNTSCGVIACVVQLATNDMCLVIHLAKMPPPIPKKLIHLFKSDAWTKVGVGLDNDIKILTRNYNLEYCSNVKDLREFALLAKIPNPSLENMYNILFNKNIKKGKGKGDWHNELTNKDIDYAAKDAIMSYKIGWSLFSVVSEFLRDMSINDDIQIKVIHNPYSLSHFNNSNINSNTSNENNDEINNNVIDTTDYISLLNDISQRHNFDRPVYEDQGIIENEFTYTTTFADLTANGAGKNKKDAKKDCAKKIYYMYCDKSCE